MLLDIKYHGIPLEVDGTFYPRRPATRFDPEEGGDFEIDRVLHKGEDISDLIDVEELETFCYEYMLGDKYERRVEAAEMRADELRYGT